MNSKLIVGDVLVELQNMDDNSVDLVFGSPPYADKGERYGTDEVWPTQAWVDWMRKITVEAVRVSKGYVVWVVNSFNKNGEYHPSCELLLTDLYKAPGVVCQRPVIWHKNSSPVKMNWFSPSFEYCLSFYSREKSPTFNWEAVAAPPAYKSGGKFRQRNRKGERVEGNEYPQTKLARPKDVFHEPTDEVQYITVGGGHMGHKLAHKNEAPFPLKLAEKFVLACSNKGDTVLDPFSGSATTGHACILHDRNYIGIDIRESQKALGQQRLDDVRASIGEFNTSSID